MLKLVIKAFENLAYMYLYDTFIIIMIMHTKVYLAFQPFSAGV